MRVKIPQDAISHVYITTTGVQHSQPPYWATIEPMVRNVIEGKSMFPGNVDAATFHDGRVCVSVSWEDGTHDHVVIAGTYAPQAREAFPEIFTT